MSKQRKTYRLWQSVEELLEVKAKEMNLTPAKALNVILSKALGSDEPDTDDDDEPEDPLPEIATHDAF